MANSMEKIDLLEDRVSKILNIVGKLQKQNKVLADENTKIKNDLSEKEKALFSMEEEYYSLKAEVGNLSADQENIQSKIDHMIKNLDNIETAAETAAGPSQIEPPKAEINPQPKAAAAPVKPVKTISEDTILDQEVLEDTAEEEMEEIDINPFDEVKEEKTDGEIIEVGTGPDEESLGKLL